jgi:hypothetical protein
MCELDITPPPPLLLSQTLTLVLILSQGGLDHQILKVPQITNHFLLNTPVNLNFLIKSYPLTTPHYLNQPPIITQHYCVVIMTLTNLEFQMIHRHSNPILINLVLIQSKLFS